MQTNRTLSAIGSVGILLLSVAYFPALAAEAEKPTPVKIAVFDFELEDVSPDQAPSLGESKLTAVGNIPSWPHVRAVQRNMNCLSRQAADSPTPDPAAARVENLSGS
jgi:hypothetical protein